MTVVDVDSHWEPYGRPARELPLHPFADRVPSTEQMLVTGLAGDLWRGLPPHLRPAPGDVLSGMTSFMGVRPEHFDEDMAGKAPPGSADVADRLAWMDRVGIDVALVNTGGSVLNTMSPGVVTEVFPDAEERHRAIVLCNDHLADDLDGHTDRLSPVTLVDAEDLDWSVGELQRMRARGSRAFYATAVPYEGRSPAHPASDRLWSAAVGLGMIGIVHVGHTPAWFGDGWADAGWHVPGGAGNAGLLMMNNSRRTEAAERFVSEMAFGGAFARNPDLTIVLEELRVGWLPMVVERLSELGALEMFGEWPYPVTAAECLRRGVRASPLPGLGDRGLGPIDEIPDLLVFSSDYPHAEGNADPIALYGAALDDLDPALRRSFLGGNILECFARTGDPLAV